MWAIAQVRGPLVQWGIAQVRGHQMLWAIAQVGGHHPSILHTQVASEDMPTSIFSSEVGFGVGGIHSF